MLTGLHDLEQVDGVPGLDGRGHEVVDDEQPYGFVLVHLLVVAVVGGGTRPVEVVADVGEAGVAHRDEFAAGGVAEGLADNARLVAHFG